MKYLRPLFFLLAVVLTAAIIAILGPAEIIKDIRLVGWKMVWIYLLGFPRYFAYTLGWMIFLPRGHYSLGRLYQIKISGELISRATPVHFFGGDAARVMLMGSDLPRHQLAGSVIVDRTAMSLGAAVMILVGMIVANLILPLPLYLKAPLWLGVGLLFWGLFFVISHQKKTALGSLLNVLGKIGLARWIRPNWRQRLAEVDEIVRGYYEAGHSKLIAAVGINIVGRLLNALEVYLLLIFLKIPLGFSEAILLSSLALFMTLIFFILPGNLGVLEGSYALLFRWLGLNPTLGVVMELLRKVNACLWYLVGGVIALTFKRNSSVNPPLKIRGGELPKATREL